MSYQVNRPMNSFSPDLPPSPDFVDHDDHLLSHVRTTVNTFRLRGPDHTSHVYISAAGSLSWRDASHNPSIFIERTHWGL